jgi:hypothetical protein
MKKYIIISIFAILLVASFLLSAFLFLEVSELRESIKRLENYIETTAKSDDEPVLEPESDNQLVDNADNETEKPQENTNDSSTCSSSKTHTINDMSEVSVLCGDYIVVSIDYKPSTGYEPYQPLYDKKYLILADSTDEHKSNGLPGGDTSTRTYKFRTEKKTSRTTLKVGIHREWDNSTKVVLQETVITIN